MIRKIYTETLLKHSQHNIVQISKKKEHGGNLIKQITLRKRTPKL